MTTLDKIQKVMRVFKTLTKIAMILSYVAAGLMLVGAGQISLNSVGINIPLLDSFTDTTGVDVQQAKWIVIATGITVLVTAILLTLAYLYFAMEVKFGTPFTIVGAQIIKLLGICSIVLSLISMSVTDAIYERIGLSAWNNFDNAGGVTLGVCLILLSLILRYGAELEILNDSHQEQT